MGPVKQSQAFFIGMHKLEIKLIRDKFHGSGVVKTGMR